MSDEGFADFESFDDPPIRLPYKGKKYELRPVDAQFALWIEAAEAGATTPLKKMTDEDQMRRLIGPSYDEMLADKVPAKFLIRAQQVAMVELKAGRAASEMVWRAGVDPELLAAEMAAAQGQTTSSSTDEADKIPSPASTSGTRSRKKPQDRKAPVSRSRTSSGSGGRSRRTGGSTTTAT